MNMAVKFINSSPRIPLVKSDCLASICPFILIIPIGAGVKQYENKLDDLTRASLVLFFLEQNRDNISKN